MGFGIMTYCKPQKTGPIELGRVSVGLVGLMGLWAVRF